jgi:hypothetical protein
MYISGFLKFDLRNDLRNRLVFHFAIDEIGRQNELLELSEPIFVSAMGQTNGQVYYELADLCVLSCNNHEGAYLGHQSLSPSKHCISEFNAN